ncbi:HTH domain-containing protein [Salinirubellus sp. GCM10025818]|uniref:L,D-transpeptidase n=1 Tax=Salinirubellus TaxID=2162630 RepID=UPI0030D52515
MNHHEPRTDVRVEVWMRDASPLPDDPRATVLARLREFEAEGIVDDVSVRIWGTFLAVPEDGTDELDPPIRGRVGKFQRWAERNGHSLEPAFDRFERSSIVSEGETDVIRLPMQCLAVYEDDRLVGVFPCSTGDGTNTVADCVDRLETGDVVGDSDVE